MPKTHPLHGRRPDRRSQDEHDRRLTWPEAGRPRAAFRIPRPRRGAKAVTEIIICSVALVKLRQLVEAAVTVASTRPHTA
jgi:hypothetical protein